MPPVREIYAKQPALSMITLGAALELPKSVAVALEVRFRYRTATRVDTLGGNAGEGRGFRGFRHFRNLLGQNPKMLQ